MKSVCEQPGLRPVALLIFSSIVSCPVEGFARDAHDIIVAHVQQASTPTDAVEASEMTNEEMDALEERLTFLRKRPGHNDRWMNLRFYLSRSWNSDDASPSRPGIPFRRSIRLSATTGSLKGSLTLQNDPLEQFLWKPKIGWYGFDHVAGYVLWTPRFTPIEIIAGDYTVDAGQGLAHARPFGTRLSSSAPWLVLRSWSGIRGYAGSSDQMRFRGIGVRLSLPRHFLVQFFYSNTRVDSRVVRSLAGQSPPAQQEHSQADAYSLVQSGLHVTEAQIERRDNLTIGAHGSMLEWRGPSGRIGIIYSKTRFGESILLSDSDRPRRSVTSLAFFWKMTFKTIRFVGEVSPDVLGSINAFAGGLWRPRKPFRLYVAYSHFPNPDLQLYGKPFAAKKSLGSQDGLLFGVGIQLTRAWSLSSAVQLRSADGSPATRGIPIKSSDLRVVLLLELSDETSLTILLRTKRSEERSSHVLSSGSIVEKRAATEFLQSTVLISHALNRHFALSVRLDLNRSFESGSRRTTGLHGYQQIDFTLWRGITVSVRESFFAAPEFENRFYIYERDVLGRLSVPVLQSAGHRSVVLISIPLGIRWTIQTKLGATTSRAHAEATNSAERFLAPRHIRTFSVQLIASL